MDPKLVARIGILLASIATPAINKHLNLGLDEDTVGVFTAGALSYLFYSMHKGQIVSDAKTAGVEAAKTATSDDALKAFDAAAAEGQKIIDEKAKTTEEKK